MDTISEAASLDDITHWAPAGSCARLQMLRLDKIHPVISGNKWFKLRYNVAAALQQHKTTLLTFGGGHSNHLAATAYAARLAGLQSIGIVRGHYTGGHITPTLRACSEYGMKLLPVTKAEYAACASAGSTSPLSGQFPDAFIIPEGGANEAGTRGAAGIAGLVPEDATDVCVAVGTGTTFAGWHAALPPHMHLNGFCAARNCDAANALISGMPDRSRANIRPVGAARFGKWTDELLHFIKAFYQHTGILLDVVYTGKMMMTLYGMLAGKSFGHERRIVCIHTGGLQGNPPGLFA